MKISRNILEGHHDTGNGHQAASDDVVDPFGSLLLESLGPVKKRVVVLLSSMAKDASAWWSGGCGGD